MLKKLVQNCIVPPELQGTELGILKVTYNRGRKSGGSGRWYSKDGIGLQPLVSCVRHTICEGIWVDIDQVNSHPTILKLLMDKYNLKSKLLDDCVNNRDEFLKKIDSDRSKAKTQVISLINGGSPNSNKFLIKFEEELKSSIEVITTHADYEYIFNYVKDTYPNEKNITGKVISRILQIIENQLLEAYLDWGYKNGFIDEDNNVSLIFDGFQLLSKHNITDELLQECRKYAIKKTGYDIELKIKPFDNPFILPDDYATSIDLCVELCDRFNSTINLSFLEYAIHDVIQSKASHLKVAELGALIFKDWTYYDSKAERWYYCDENNIWIESKEPYILKYLIQKVLGRIFETERNELMKKIDELNMKEVKDDKQISPLNEKLKNIMFTLSSLQNSTFIEGVMRNKVLYLKDGFYEDYIDSKPYLYAFKNKVYDFRTKKLRYIKTDDYIMTNTGYNYPENIKEENILYINKYFDTLFPNIEMKDYILDSCCSTLNGEKREQYFNIHTGNGSNSKTTFSGLYESALGGYACEVSPETFTKPKKSANDTGELYKAKGKRCVFTNEPEADTDKLQTAILKRIADEGGRKIIARQLYGYPVEFAITFQLNMFCNNKPELSSVDGGIARRLRVVEWKMKFVDEPDPNNKYQAPRDAELMAKIKTDDIRNAFVRMLLDRWDKRVSAFKLIPVPNEIKDASNDFVDDSNPVLGFIMSNYEITNNENDKIGSDKLFTHFAGSCRDSKVCSKRFKDDMLGISGVSFKKTNKGRYYIGLK